MTIGDIVTMKADPKLEGRGLGLIQEIVPTSWSGKIYHILWPDGAISCQYENEIVLMGATE